MNNITKYFVTYQYDTGSIKDNLNKIQDFMIDIDTENKNSEEIVSSIRKEIKIFLIDHGIYCYFTITGIFKLN